MGTPKKITNQPPRAQTSTTLTLRARVTKAMPPFLFSIRSRMLLLGSLLVVLSVAGPLHILGNMFHIVDIHQQSTTLVQALGYTQRLVTLTLQTPTDQKMAYNNRNEFLNNLDRLESIFSSLALDYAFLKQIKRDHSQWLTHLSSAPSAQSLSELQKTSLTLSRSIKRLDQEIRDALANRGRDVSRIVKRTENFVIAVTIVYVLSIATLMYSLWSIIIPGFHALLNAAHSIKRGDLTHRIQGKAMRGRDEFSILGQAFNEMAESLVEQNEKLIELNRIKTDFVSTVSHELRTPLTAIKGGLGLVLGGVTGPISSEAKELLDTAKKNTERLVRLINDVLDISKMEAGALKLHLAKYDVSDLISQSVANINSYASHHNVKVSWLPQPNSPIIVVDRDRFQQIMDNLLSNAIKYGPDAGRVEIQLIEHDDHVTIRVSDNGPGIPADKQHLLFRRFQQINKAPGTKSKGTGLGLSICKSLVEQHGGRIWVESIEGLGSDFYFTLPWNGVDRHSPTSGSDSGAGSDSSSGLEGKLAS